MCYVRRGSFPKEACPGGLLGIAKIAVRACGAREAQRDLLEESPADLRGSLSLQYE